MSLLRPRRAVHPDRRPQRERWYIHVERRERYWCREVIGEVAYLALDPRLDASQDDVWLVDMFVKLFRPCEDLSRAHTLGPCPSTCPVCFAPAINHAAERAVEWVAYEERKRAQKAYDRRQRVAAKRRATTR